MIKRSSLRRICVATLALFILLIIYFFPTTNNISESLSYIEKDEMPIFLVDQMDYIARTTIVKDSNTLENQILEIVETLTVDSKKSSYIRDGFKPIIPKNTKVLNTDLTEGVLTINFRSEERRVGKEC